MAEPLLVDFIHMPWTQSKASWAHSAPEAFAALERVTSAIGESVTLQCKASGNDELSAEVEVESTSFRAHIAISSQDQLHGLTPDALLAMNDGQLARLLEGRVVFSAPSTDEVVITLHESFTEEPGPKRLRQVLDTVMDLEYLAVYVLMEVYGAVNRLEVTERQQSLHTQLSHDDSN